MPVRFNLGCFRKKKETSEERSARTWAKLVKQANKKCTS